MKKLQIAAINAIMFSALLVFVNGCGGGSDNVEVVDLNRVLDIMTKTFDDMQARMGTKFQGNSEDTAARDKFMREFNINYAENLNVPPPISSKPIGTQVETDGSITGFTDENKNMAIDSTDKKLFKIELDMDRNRMIATDLQNGYRRDSGFSMGGLVAGMLIGHMLSRQRGAGISGSRFANTKMSPKNYHSAAQQRAKSTARAKSGSGSFSRGK